jgi:hypothetical protein
MNAIGSIALILFMVCWAGGVTSWFYGAYHLIMSWSRWRDPDSHSRHMRKLLKAGVLFLGCGLFGLASGFVGGTFGGWEQLGTQHQERSPW